MDPNIPLLPEDVTDYLSAFYKAYGFSLSVKNKSSSKLMRAIGWLFGVTKISPEFMTRYITTIGDTVYFPDEMLQNQDSERILRVMVHESVHAYDSKKLTGPLFKFLYLFPQSLAPLALLSFLAFWKPMFLWCLLFLLGLAPIPAPFRYLFELRAYRTSLIFARKTDKSTNEQINGIHDWIIKQLCTNLYYWTWPFPKKVKQHLLDESWMNTGVYKTIGKWVVVRSIINIYKENGSRKL